VRSNRIDGSMNIYVTLTLFINRYIILNPYEHDLFLFYQSSAILHLLIVYIRIGSALGFLLSVYTVSGFPPLTVSGLPPSTVSGLPPLTVSGLPPFLVLYC